MILPLRFLSYSFELEERRLASCCFSYLPLVELLAELHLLLNGFQQLTVDLEDIDSCASQFDFGRVLTSHGLISYFPCPSDDLVFGQVSVSDISTCRVTFLASRFQLPFFQCQLLIKQQQPKIRWGGRNCRVNRPSLPMFFNDMYYTVILS